MGLWDAQVRSESEPAPTARAAPTPVERVVELLEQLYAVAPGLVEQLMEALGDCDMYG
jgi:hypothetical protein